MEKLSYLNLEANRRLRCFPGTPKNLKTLNMRDCGIESLPSDLFQHNLVNVELYGNKGLKTLPILPPESPLEYLNVENCGIEKIHESFIRPGIQLNLRNNQLKELPRDHLLRFLEMGGSLRKERDGPYITVDYNPLEYPPKHVLE